MKVFKIKVTPFPGDLHLLIGEKVDITKELNRRNIKDYNEIFTPGTDAACVSVETKNGIAVAVLLTPNIDDDTVWHECLHAAWYVLDIYGVKLNVDNHEALVYMQEYFHAEIKKRMK